MVQVRLFPDFDFLKYESNLLQMQIHGRIALKLMMTGPVEFVNS